jgi:hypothetical protein
VDSLRQEIEQEKNRYAKKIDRIFEEIDTDSIDQVNASVPRNNSTSDPNSPNINKKSNPGATENENGRGDFYAGTKSDSNGAFT